MPETIIVIVHNVTIAQVIYFIFCNKKQIMMNEQQCSFIS